MIGGWWWPQGLLTCLQEHGFRPAVFDLREAGQSTRMRQHSAAGPHRTMLARRSAAYRAEDLAGIAKDFGVNV